LSQLRGFLGAPDVPEWVDVLKVFPRIGFMLDEIAPPSISRDLVQIAVICSGLSRVLVE
jgi:hypothetical protein